MKALLECLLAGMVLAYIFCWAGLNVAAEEWHDFFTWTLGAVALSVIYIREIRSTFQNYLSLDIHDKTASDKIFRSAQVRIRKADTIITSLLLAQVMMVLILKLHKILNFSRPDILGYYALAFSIGGFAFAVRVYITGQESELKLQDELRKYNQRHEAREASRERTLNLMQKLPKAEDQNFASKPIRKVQKVKPPTPQKDKL